MFATPELPEPSAASIAMSTGVEFVQPPGQALPSQVSELVGAAPSAFAVKLVPEPSRPAPLVAVIEPDCVPAVASYV